jgi:NAD(P)-dependent dehydrogenase (short-subunit alcohol dehydrogenase family)
VARENVVLITGSSSGFGRLTAETLARKKYFVFATMRDVAGRNAKAANELKTLAEAYRDELAGQGIDSIIIEPGPYATSIFSRFEAPEDAARSVAFHVPRMSRGQPESSGLRQSSFSSARCSTPTSCCRACAA